MAAIRDVRIDSTYTKNSQMILDKIGTLEVGFQMIESRITETENQIAEQLNEQLDFTRSFYDANGNLTMQETGTSNRAKNIEQRAKTTEQTTTQTDLTLVKQELTTLQSETQENYKLLKEIKEQFRQKPAGNNWWKWFCGGIVLGIVGRWIVKKYLGGWFLNWKGKKKQ